MGLFDRFRKPKQDTTQQDPEISLPQLCYDVAYFVLPHYAYNEVDKLAHQCRNAPTVAGPYYYVMACLMRKVEPDVEVGKCFRWHHGELNDASEYFVLEYPPPPPVDMSDTPIEQLVNGASPFVLAPHFSAVVRERSSGASHYFVLGQAPIGGGTTLRSVQPEGMNCNLGPGPVPRLADFLDAIRQR